MYQLRPRLCQVWVTFSSNLQRSHSGAAGLGVPAAPPNPRPPSELVVSLSGGGFQRPAGGREGGAAPPSASAATSWLLCRLFMAVSKQVVGKNKW